MKMLPGSFLVLAGVFTYKKQCRTVILTDFAEIHRGPNTPTARPSSAPVQKNIKENVGLAFSWKGMIVYEGSMLESQT
jgi:hypothetical protein